MDRGRVNRPLRFYGLPTGQFLVVFVDSLVAASQKTPKPPPEVTAIPKKLRPNVYMRVLGALRQVPAATAFTLALLSDKIESSVFEIEEYPDLAMQLKLTRIPLILVNGAIGFGGVILPGQ